MFLIRVLSIIKVTALASYIISMLILSACNKAYTPYDYYAKVYGEENLCFDDDGELCWTTPYDRKIKLQWEDNEIEENDEINIVVDSITESGHLKYRMENISQDKTYIYQASFEGISVLIERAWYKLPISYSSTLEMIYILKDEPIYGGLSLNPEHTSYMIACFPSGHYRIECKYEDELVIAEFELINSDCKYSLG